MNDNLKLNFSVVLVQPQTAGNIGAIARLCKNFNVKKLVLIDPQADHLSDSSLARAMHSQEYLQRAIVYSTFKQLRQEYELLIATSAKAGNNYHITRQPAYPWDVAKVFSNNEEMAFVFGREDKGLFNVELDLCDFLVHIPLTGEHIVLNLSHAVGIILYEIWRSIYLDHIKPKNQEIIAEVKSRAVLFEKFDSIIDSLQYETYRKPIIKQAFRFLINRSFIRPVEVHSFIGVFNHILRTIKNGTDANETKGH